MAVTTLARSALEEFLDTHAVDAFEHRLKNWHRLETSSLSIEKFSSYADIYNLGLKYPGDPGAAYLLFEQARGLDLEPKYWLMAQQARNELQYMYFENSARRAVEPLDTLFGMEIRTV